MRSYEKIDGPFVRDLSTKKVIPWEWRRPEFRALQDAPWIATEKLDGMNIQVSWEPENGAVGFYGRTARANIPTSLREFLCSRFTPDTFEGCPPMVLYGEGIGPKIQNGGTYCEDQRFVLFDVFVGGDGGRYLSRNELLETVAEWGDGLNSFPVDVVPQAAAAKLHILIEWAMEDLFSWSSYAEAQGRGKQPCEGVVAVPNPPLRDIYGHRLIVKLKNRDLYAGT